MLRLAAWRALTLSPLALAVHELLLGVEAGPVANARACALPGDALLLVARRARPARGARVLFAPPAGGGAGAAAGVVRGVPGDVAEGADGRLRPLAEGELWVVAGGGAGGGAGGALDSEAFGPLPRALVRGVPVAELSLARGLRWIDAEGD